MYFDNDQSLGEKKTLTAHPAHEAQGLSWRKKEAFSPTEGGVKSTGHIRIQYGEKDGLTHNLKTLAHEERKREREKLYIGLILR